MGKYRLIAGLMIGIPFYMAAFGTSTVTSPSHGFKTEFYRENNRSMDNINIQSSDRKPISVNETTVFFGKHKAEDTRVRLDVDLTWNPETERPSSITLMNEDTYLTASLDDMPPEAKGFYIPLEPGQEGIYQVIMCFQKLDALMFEGHRSFIISEDCDLTANLALDINADMADRLIKFRSFNRDGAETTVTNFMMGEEGYYEIEKGNARVVNISDILIYKDNLFYTTPTWGIDGKMNFPDEYGISLEDAGLGIGDIYINEVSDNWKIGQYRCIYSQDKCTTDFAVILSSLDEDIKEATNNPYIYYSYKPKFLLPANENPGDFKYGIFPSITSTDSFLAGGASLYMKEPDISVCIPDECEFIEFNTSTSFIITRDATFDHQTIITSPQLFLSSKIPLWYYSRPLVSILAMNNKMESGYFNIPELNGKVTSETILGTTAPYAVVGMGRNYTSESEFTYNLNCVFAGSFGETYNYEISTMLNSIKCNGKLLLRNTNLSEFGNIYATKGSPKGNFEMRMEVSRPLSNGLDRKTTVDSKWNNTSSTQDHTPPTLTFLQFRDKEGIVGDNFINADDGLIYMTAGDFEPRVILNAIENEYGSFNYDYFEYQASQVRLEYRPDGSEQFYGLEIKEIPENFNEHGFGAFYTCELGQIATGSTSGWFDLRITIMDQAGNSQIQTLEKAFKIDALSRVDKVTEDTEEIIVNGNNILAPPYYKVYTTSGIMTSPYNLSPGIYMVRSDCKTHKVIIK